jgi:hypothetical protein
LGLLFGALLLHQGANVKVIFLDFDGVLNSSEWFMDNQKLIRESTSLLQRGAAELNPVLIRRVLEIIEATGAAVVVSSSWRILHTRDELNEIFKQAGFPQMVDHIIDVTPRDRGQSYNETRGREIEAWIKGYEEKNGRLDSYVIIDDDGDMLSHQRPLFVQTSWDFGILPKDVQQAIRILGVQDVKI